MTVFCRKNHSKRKSAIRNQSQKKSASNNRTSEVIKKKETDQPITKNTPIRMLPEELAETEADAEEEEMIMESSKEEVKYITTTRI